MRQQKRRKNKNSLKKTVIPATIIVGGIIGGILLASQLGGNGKGDILNNPGTDLDKTDYSSITNDVIDFTNGLNIYVDASDNLVIGNDNVIDKTLDELIDLENAPEDERLDGIIVEIPDYWEDLFETDVPVITEDDGDYYMTLVWADNGRFVFTDERFDISEINNDLGDFINDQNWPDIVYPVSNDDEVIVVYDKVRVDIYDFVEAMHIWLWSGGGGVNVYDIVDGSYYMSPDTSKGMIFYNSAGQYFNDGTYNFDSSRKAYADNLITNNFSLQYAINNVGGLPADYWFTHLHRNRNMLSSNGSDYYFQIYWSDGTPVFKEGICLTTNYGDEANLLNEYYSQIAEPSRFKEY